MNRERIIRVLRITTSAGFGVLCLLLMALWVRSYSIQDKLWLSYFDSYFTNITSLQGRFVISDRHSPFEGQLRLSSFSIKQITDSTGLYSNPRWFRVFKWSKPVHIPMWFPVTLTAAFTVLPWLRFQFSLHTLLIATTLVAVILGAVVIASR